MTDTPDRDRAAEMNATRGGFNTAMGLHFVRATRSEVVAELTIGANHSQPYGIVHGGVHAGIIETVCSVGAALDAEAYGRTAVGLENSTTFLRAARSGVLRVTARPLTRGRRTQVWEATVADDEGRTLAAGRVRLICLEPESELAGRKVAVEA
jgi:1,4-dihydroxy-2-naphthoyl-CoA hydrolase